MVADMNAPIFGLKSMSNVGEFFVFTRAHGCGYESNFLQNFTQVPIMGFP